MFSGQALAAERQLRRQHARRKCMPPLALDAQKRELLIGDVVCLMCVGLNEQFEMGNQPCRHYTLLKPVD